MADARITNTIPEAAGRLREAMVEVLSQELEALVEELAGKTNINLRDFGITNLGTLNFTPQIFRDANRNIVAARVGSPVGYGSYVEMGTRPHYPPIEPLYRWVEEKFKYLSMEVEFSSGRALPTGKGKRRFTSKTEYTESRTGNTYNRQIYRVAKAIQQSIGKRGTVGKRYMRAALEQMNLPYEEVENAPYMTYAIDPTDWIEGRGFWDKVNSRMAEA